MLSLCWCNVPELGSEYVHQNVLGPFFRIPPIYIPSTCCSIPAVLQFTWGQSHFQASCFWLHLSSDDIVLHWPHRTKAVNTSASQIAIFGVNALSQLLCFEWLLTGPGASHARLHHRVLQPEFSLEIHPSRKTNYIFIQECVLSLCCCKMLAISFRFSHEKDNCIKHIMHKEKKHPCRVINFWTLVAHLNVWNLCGSCFFGGVRKNSLCI